MRIPVVKGSGERRRSGRRLRADAARNRRRVLAAAREVFGEFGPDARMEEVSRRAGVGVGTLYRHFPTKAALLDALVSERLGGLAEAAEAALRDPDSWAAFRGMVWRTVEAAAEDRALLGAFAPPAQLSVPPLTGTEGERGGPPGPRGVEDLMGKLLRRAQEDGEARGDVDVADLPPMFAGVMVMAMDAPRKDREDEPWRRYVTVLLDGLRESSRGAGDR
jgi:AcrR family transcriptional regulator